MREREEQKENLGILGIIEQLGDLTYKFQKIQ